MWPRGRRSGRCPISRELGRHPDRPPPRSAPLGVRRPGQRDPALAAAARAPPLGADAEQPPLPRRAGARARSRPRRPARVGQGASHRPGGPRAADDGRSYLVANMHCTSIASDERLADAELLRAAWFATSHARPEDVVVLAGDFNVRPRDVGRRCTQLAGPEWGFSHRARDRPRSRARRAVLDGQAVGRRAASIAAVSCCQITPRSSSTSRRPSSTGDRLERRDHVRDVLVELQLEQLRAFVDVVPRDARRERRLLQLLLDRLRLEPFEAGRPDEAARMNEAGELVAREERLLERRVAREREVVRVRQHGVDHDLRIALLAQDRRAVLRMLVERRVDLVVEVVEQRRDAPELLVLAETRPRTRPSRPRRRARGAAAPRSSCSA